MRNAPVTSTASEGANAHSGMAASAPTSESTMERRRPSRSDTSPTSTPPAMAPSIEKAVSAARRAGVNPQSRWRKVGYMSWVPCETKFIIAISSTR